MKVRYSIGTKLIAISSAIVVSALVFVTFLVSYFITLDIRRNAESNNLALNSRTAADCQNRIKNAIRDSLGEFLWRRTKRKPMILPVIMEVDE